MWLACKTIITQHNNKKRFTATFMQPPVTNLFYLQSQCVVLPPSPVFISSIDETCPPCGQYEHCDSYTDYECVCENGFTGSPGNCSGI